MLASATPHAAEPIKEKSSMQAEHTLSASRLAIAPIGAFAATGNLPALHAALDQGLDAGLSVGDCKEILVQLYAYAGFPRSLNALGELMKVLEERKGRGIADAPGSLPGPVPSGDAMFALGTANQTKLVGAPVKGPVFEFAPAIDQFLKTHLFGDIFSRDNLDWQSRELATVAALAAMSGTEPQLLSHLRVSLNVGLTPQQLKQFIQVLALKVDVGASQRAQAALEKAS
ncbi:carboxymuconolactone decarboxylase [Duganella sp. SAP-35]|uniref:Carboxymuconolactone decarboxylase n=2 Tax=Duganella aceris TaxID=2703883 RepID=A0ABX0FL69_9BURK|nr:carboxymuconolactone decarboxylase [Duganella aceris]